MAGNMTSDRRLVEQSVDIIDNNDHYYYKGCRLDALIIA